jgi:hypothetical protein
MRRLLRLAAVVATVVGAVFTAPALTAGSQSPAKGAARTTSAGNAPPLPHGAAAARAAGAQAGPDRPNVVPPRSASPISPQVGPSAQIQPADYATYQVYATQYYPNTPGSAEIAVPDQCAKFASLDWTGALAQYGCPAGYQPGMNWNALVQTSSGRSAVLPVKDTGPWNVDDNYWDPTTGPRPRRLFQDLPQGTPEAQAAYYNGYNPSADCDDLSGNPTGHPGDVDQFGRCVLNPAGLDISTTAAAELGIPNLASEWVTVSFLWEPVDGNFVSTPDGKVWRIVGGAPVYISDWSIFGGPQPTVAVPNLDGFRQTPADASFVLAEPSGEVFRFVGGAPVYISDWNGVGGIQPAVVVNDASLSSSTQFSFGHVAQYPANGSFVSAEPSGRVYRFAGGAPLYISSWDLFGGVQPYVVVNDGTLSSASQYSFGHLRASPEDGTVVEGLPSQTYWVFQNGAVSPTAPVAGAVQVNDFSVTPFVSEPAVTSVSPDVVPAAGGSTVTISGNGFEGATKVSFGSSPASSFSVTSPTSITALAPAGSGTVDVTVSSSSGTSATSGADKVLYAAPGSYHPLGPTRVLDTRNGTGGHSGALGAGQSLSLQLSGTGHPVPQGATAAVLNLVATDATAASYLTAYPSGEAVPGASNLNFGAGETLSNLVVVALSPTGSVSIYNNSGSTDVVADLEGYMGAPSSSAGRFNPLSPARILDTRADLGHTGALGPGQSIELKVTGNGGVPASGVSAVELNLTAAYATASSYLSVFPAGQALPGTSNLNFGPGEPLPLPNRVIVAVGSGGQISIYNNSGFTDVVADVGGWYSDSSTSSGDLFTPVSPTRILDTRSGTGHSGPLGPGSSIGLAVAGTDGIPSDAAAVVANTTVTDTSASSFLTLYPWGQSPPGTSDLNWSAGETIANLTLPPTGSGGQVGIFNQAGFADVVADVEGWYSP